MFEGNFTDRIRQLFAQASVIALMACVLGAPVTLRGKQRAPEFHPNRLIIQLKEGIKEESLEEIHLQHGNKLRRKFKKTKGMHLLQLPRGKNPVAEAQKYLQTGLVEFAEPDYIVRRSLEPNDPSYSANALWGLNNVGQNGGKADGDIDAPEAWNTVRQAEKVIVAVIDSGIRYTHEDLAPNMWRNPGEVPNGLDDDDNGIIDDIHGFDSLTMSGDPMDDDGHGTHVAGTIGAVGNNGKGITGVAWNVQLMALRFLSAEGDGSTSDAIECINYAVANGARVINASWGGPGASYALERAIRNAGNAGVILVTAAGNEAADNDLVPTYPGNYPLKNIVTVAATNPQDVLDPYYSNYGAARVHLAAPGTGILSTWFGSDSSYLALSGTSMASPHVAGALALLRGYYTNETHIGSIQRLLQGTDKLPSLAGKVSSGGRLNLAKLFPRAWEIQLHNEGSGTVLLSPQQLSYSDGTTLQATATAAPGHQFTGWAGAAAGLLNPLTLLITNNLNLTAMFKPLWNLTVSTRGEGTVSILPAGDTFIHGTEVQLVATASAGYEFSHWTGAAQGSIPSLSLTMDKDKTVQAEFIPTFSLLVEQTAGGKVHYSPVKPRYRAGDVVHISALPDPGFLFGGWVQGETVSELDIVMSADVILTPQYFKNIQPTYAIVLSPSAHGKLTLDPVKESYTAGERVQISAEPSPGFEFAGWEGIGLESPSGTIEVVSNLAISATFTPVWTLNLTQAVGGTVEVSPTKSIYHNGEAVILKATPASGYDFVSWSGLPADATNEMEVQVQISTNLAVAAEFVKLLALKTSVDGQGKILVVPQKEFYRPGDQVELIASTQNSTFIEWSGDVGEGAKENIITVVMNKDLHVEAHFEDAPGELTLVFLPEIDGELGFLVKGAVATLQLEASADLETWVPLPENSRNQTAEGLIIRTPKPGGGTRYFRAALGR